MIPSDHFVRFYNEVFKFLDEKQGLEAYYSHISSHQEFHCLKEFSERGLQGVYDYYVKIRKEENCDMDIEFREGGLMLKMNICPSLTKALDNDAGVCKKYCMHCPGWTLPLYTKAGLYQIFDLVSTEIPQCVEWIYTDRQPAEKKYRELEEIRSTLLLKKNF